MDTIKNWLKNTFPHLHKVFCEMLSLYKDIILNILIYKASRKQDMALNNAKKKKRLKCVFFVVFYQSWKYEGVYRLMETIDRFEPIVIICPSVNFGRAKMLLHLNESYNYFFANNYNVIKAYNENTDEYLDIKNRIMPDIVFYTNPYKGLIDDRYYITNYLDTLTVYVPYAFNNNIDFNFCQNQPLHNLVWRYYAESDEHVSYSRKYSNCKGRNVVCSGYPGVELLINKEYKCQYKDWKIKDKSLKRIIWAPHHSIENTGIVNYSCFLYYMDFMLEMAKKYKECVQFVFKPHPLLKDKLDILLGKEKADEYYDQWRRGCNCNLNDGDYVDLFYSSDAMIHDSGSFLIEYLYVNKPVMRTTNGIPFSKMYNSFAQKCLENYYLASNKSDVENFIVDIINDKDPLKDQRTHFVNHVLMPNGSPSQNIIDDIVYSIDNQILYHV